MAKEMDVPFLGTIPLDPGLLRACEAGKSYATWLVCRLLSFSALIRFDSSDIFFLKLAPTVLF